MCLTDSVLQRYLGVWGSVVRHATWHARECFTWWLGIGTSNVWWLYIYLHRRLYTHERGTDSFLTWWNQDWYFPNLMEPNSRWNQLRFPKRIRNTIILAVDRQSRCIWRIRKAFEGKQDQLVDKINTEDYSGLFVKLQAKGIIARLHKRWGC